MDELPVQSDIGPPDIGQSDAGQPDANQPDMSQSGVSLYSAPQVALASVLGTPVAGSILMAGNFRKLGQSAKANAAIAMGLALTAVFVWIAFYLPDKSPNAILPAVYVGLMYLWYRQAQEEDYKRVIEAGGTQMPFKPAVVTGLVCLVAAVAVILGVVWIVDDSSDLGEKMVFHGGDLYYTSDVSEDQAKALGTYLVNGEFFDGSPKSVQIAKPGDVYQLRLVVQSGYKDDLSYILAAAQLARKLSDDVFEKAPVEVHICDEWFTTQRVVPAQPSSAGDDLPTAPGQPGAPNPPPGAGAAGGAVYVVRPGDTLSGIAQRFDRTVAQLQAHNGITNPNKLKVGQKIRIPPP